MARVNVIIHATIDLDDFECSNMNEFQDLLEDSEGMSLDIVDCTGETFTGELEFSSVEED